MLKLNGSLEIEAKLAQEGNGLGKISAFVRENVPQSKREIAEYQGRLLHLLAKRYNKDGQQLLEIGTAFGFSGLWIALAAKDANLTTLNPKATEYKVAVKNLSCVNNATVVNMRSDEFLKIVEGKNVYDFIFVDGDHEHVAQDLKFFDKLKVGGLLLLHDYTPQDGARPCPPVFEVANLMRTGLGRDFDVEIIDDVKVGMVGFVKRRGETWEQLNIPEDFAPWHVQYEPKKEWVRSE